MRARALCMYADETCCRLWAMASHALNRPRPQMPGSISWKYAVCVRACLKASRRRSAVQSWLLSCSGAGTQFPQRSACLLS